MIDITFQAEQRMFHLTMGKKGRRWYGTVGCFDADENKWLGIGSGYAESLLEMKTFLQNKAVEYARRFP